MAFKYERIVGWGYACGKLGHEMRFCDVPEEDSARTERPYGEWLKAGGRRRFSSDDKCQPSPPRQHGGPTASDGTNSTPPSDLIRASPREPLLTLALTALHGKNLGSNSESMKILTIPLDTAIAPQTPYDSLTTHDPDITVIDMDILPKPINTQVHDNEQGIEAGLARDSQPMHNMSVSPPSEQTPTNMAAWKKRDRPHTVVTNETLPILLLGQQREYHYIVENELA